MKDLKMKNKSRTENFYLWWVEEKTKKRYFAGVAFREEEYGEYRLKIDCYPNRRLYLKDYKTQDDAIIFRVEECKKLGNRVLRNTLGCAYSSRETKGDIEMVIAPHFDAKLVLMFKNTA